MSEIRKKIQDINNPAVHSRRSFTTTALVTNISEKTNTCSIQYINNDGLYSNKDNVYVQIIMPGFIGWFPKKDDYVKISITERNIVIMGPADDSYQTQTRSKIQSRKEILSNQFGDTMAGSIF